MPIADLYTIRVTDIVSPGTAEYDKYVILPYAQIVEESSTDYLTRGVDGSLAVRDLPSFARRGQTALALAVYRTYWNDAMHSFFRERTHLLSAPRKYEIVLQNTDTDLLEPRPIPRGYQGYLTALPSTRWNRYTHSSPQVVLNFAIDEHFDFSTGDLLKANTYWVLATHGGGTARAYGGTNNTITLPAATAITFTKKTLNTPTSHAWTLGSFTSTGGLTTGTATGTTPAAPGTYACSVVCANSAGTGNTLNFSVVVP